MHADGMEGVCFLTYGGGMRGFLVSVFKSRVVLGSINDCLVLGSEILEGAACGKNVTDIDSRGLFAVYLEMVCDSFMVCRWAGAFIN